MDSAHKAGWAGVGDALVTLGNCSQLGNTEAPLLPLVLTYHAFLPLLLQFWGVPPKKT